MNSRSCSKLRRHACSRGFTLIEVLVALSVVVISFVALYAVILQMVRATTLMQEKTFASWVAFDRITELRVSQEFPDPGEKSDVVEMGGANWLYTLEIRKTDSDDIRQVIARVSPEDEPGLTLGLITGALVRSTSTGGGSGSGPAGGFDDNNNNNGDSDDASDNNDDEASR